MKQTQSAVPTNPSAASLGRDRREKSEITDIRRFCFAFWELPSWSQMTMGQSRGIFCGEGVFCALKVEVEGEDQFAR